MSRSKTANHCFTATLEINDTEEALLIMKACLNVINDKITCCKDLKNNFSEVREQCDNLSLALDNAGYKSKLY